MPGRLYMPNVDGKDNRAGAGKWRAFTPGRLPLPVILSGLILCFVCFYGLNTVALIDLVDEGLYANSARQMIDSGDWITPRVGQEVFLDKPPLTFWCQALFILLLGPTPLAARLPSAIAAFLTALALYNWAKRRGALRTGWLAAVLYALCPLVGVGLARVAMVDSLLTLWLTLAAIGWIEGYAGDRRGYLLMAAGMGLAVMTKGAIGLLLPCGALLLWLLIRRDRAALRGVPWAPAIAIFLLLALPWHIAAWWANGDLFVREYIIHRHIQRFLGQDFGHNQPFWYYLPVLALSMFPWSAFVPAAWWQGLRARRAEKQSLDCMMAMWGLWAAVVFLFFSVSTSKLPNYILPALPALVLLVAWRLDSMWRASGKLPALESTLLVIFGSLPGLLLLVAGVLGWHWRTTPDTASWLARRVGRLFNWKEESQGVELLWAKLTPLTSLSPYWIAVGVLLILSSVIILVYRRSPAKALVSALAMSLSIIVLIAHVGLPAWDANSAAKINALGQRALPALERGEPLVLYSLHPKRISLRYLLGHNNQIYDTFSPGQLQEVLTGAGQGYVLAAKDTLLPPLPGTLQPEAEAGSWVLWRYGR